MRSQNVNNTNYPKTKGNPDPKVTTRVKEKEKEQFPANKIDIVEMIRRGRLGRD